MDDANNIVTIKRDGSKSSFFTVHGEGNVFFYAYLARHLVRDRRMYALEAYGLDGKPFPFDNLSDYAADYVRQIQNYQDSGPYHIGGYCIGAVIAFEMARQLQSSGQEVPMLVMFDTGTAVPSTEGLFHEMISEDVRATLNHVKDHYKEMVLQYRPSYYPGHVVLIQSSRQQTEDVHRPVVQRILDEFCTSHECYSVDDSNGSMFREPCVATVADIVNGLLSS